MSDAESKGRVDSWYDQVLAFVSQQISSFVAFLFLMFSAGAFYGAWVSARWHSDLHLFLLAPIAMAVIAYYNRTFATIVLILILVLAFL